MNDATPIAPRHPRPAAIGRWLRRGWEDFLVAPLPNIAYAAIFCLIGAMALLFLVRAGASLIFFVLAGGFMLVAPVLASGYYRMARCLRRREAPGFGAILRGTFDAPGAVWVIGVVSAALFLIWVTDALILYTVYFDLVQGIDVSRLTGDPATRRDALAFILFSGVMGAIIAFILYAVTALSIPFAYERRGGLVEAVVFSVKGVFGNFRIMAAWGVVLSALVFGILLIALPLILVALPVAAYGSFAAYEELSGPP